MAIRSGGLDDADPDMSLLVHAMVVVYAYGVGMPVVLYLLFRYYKMVFTLVDLLCLFGYSLAPFLPAVALCTIPINWFAWVVLATSATVSSVLLLQNIAPIGPASNHLTKEAKMLIRAFILFGGFFFLFAIKISFYQQKISHGFDLYVLAMSYQPEFCHGKNYQEYPGCSMSKPILTIHGLWPEWSDGSWPSSCSIESFDPDLVYKIGTKRFYLYWPDVKAGQGVPRYGLWEHEWVKHGTCSGLSQADYFKATLDNSIPTPGIISAEGSVLSEGSVSKQSLLDAFGYGGSLVTICNNRKFLSEVRVCFGVSNNGSPSGQIPCPSEIMSQDSCSSDIKLRV
mmetsp:Transcript_17895/g.32404  ORF Transcript_17895/g.32404 Transcript_17895/m.32404 type:complete len:340 (+) Transcript_17895:424-1443(+)